ncbi:unnamed protein product [Protopolystoma xenopodis]|uniref:Uncharacterized protein n=1 Tax=Protopolystoma xenopodis TaxID=117903 RepID=A0A3S5ATC9_9PLAT|nr:unnamed protein product [Protopolystoma xenopodis]
MLCKLEGWNKLSLTLTGLCVPPTLVKEVQQFQCPVRQTDTRLLQIANRTYIPWCLSPVFDGDRQWTGPETFEVEAQSTRAYEVTYHPLTMSLDGKKHQVNSVSLANS